LRRHLGEFGSAVALLTRLPVPAALRPDLARSVWAWPLVGAAVGALGGGVYWLARALAIPMPLATFWALAAMLALTGGFHEDGLADTADGFGGGATRERKLAIMRDSRIGSFGVLALVLSLAIRASATIALADRARVAAALIVAAALGRAAMAGIPLLLPPARPDGLGAAVRRPSWAGTATALALAGVTAFLLLPPAPAALAGVAAVVACCGLGLLARAQIGGYTGDVLGAGEQVVECVVLTLLAAQFRP
jgi:adenosylcobinamide-GDP ribazoletransferase